MRPPRIPVLSCLVAAAACAGGPPGPPALEYGPPTAASATYDYEDETIVSISAMGQSMQLTLEGTAEYGVEFASSASGLGVTMTVLDLEATLNQPMGPGLSIDESQIEGALEFSLDRLGNASITASPTVELEASQVVSGLNLAHTFFPGLPGRPVGAGDEWVDTVAYEGDEGAGSQSETMIVRYRVIGDTLVAGRSLLAIAFDGTSETATEMEIAGMAVSQTSDLEVEGHVLWDHQAGMMFESVRTGTGTGTVAVPIAPTPFPIRIETTRRVRVQDS